MRITAYWLPRLGCWKSFLSRQWGHGCTTLWMKWMPLNSILKNGQNNKFHIIYVCVSSTTIKKKIPQSPHRLKYKRKPCHYIKGRELMVIPLTKTSTMATWHMHLCASWCDVMCSIGVLLENLTRIQDMGCSVGQLAWTCQRIHVNIAENMACINMYWICELG